MRLVGIDPGGTTGWAVWENRHLESFQFGPGPHHGVLWNNLAGEFMKGSIIICEGFDPSDNPAAQAISMEYIGVVKAACDIFRMSLVIQPATFKEWASNHKLKRWGVRYTNWFTYRHEADARRHILHYICHNPHVPEDLRAATFAQLRPAA